MADDGMLLNFDVGEVSAAASKATFKGGRWKDRLTARKSVQHNRKRDTGRGANAEPLGQKTTELDIDTGRALKRQRTEGTSQGASRADGNGSKEVVSSLFTYNPKSQTSHDAHEGAVPDAAPTNAPLPEGASNFTSLGLGPLLATHLLKKMELKAPTAIQKSTISQLLKEDSDAFIQAETGSGKTLAYILPILQRLVSWSKDGQQLHRDSGLFAIILAPTRELSRQILTVLESLLGCAHWIVAGSVTGGERKKSEKARLRKGLNILVATPGRLADHLQNTTSLDVSNVRWLVLDEGDRLMELGFEQEIKGIVEALDRKRLSRALSTPERIDGFLAGLPSRRVTILCSATMKMNVQKLGEVSLKDAVHLQASGENRQPKDEAKFSAPAQMKQSYILVPPKQRLITLAALLRRTFARKGSVMKAIVFLSCADSVDFHFEALRRKRSEDATDEPQKPSKPGKPSSSAEPQQTASPPPSPEPAKVSKPGPKRAETGSSLGPITNSPAPQLASTSNPDLEIFRLHGSLAQPVRTSTLKAFSKTSNPAVLLCTDVASRGLDLPSIDLVIEYDPAFSAEDHLHRVGRTARAGREGRAILFLMPGPEEGYIELLEQESSGESGKRKIGRIDADETLKRGFGEEEAVTKARGDTKGAKGKFQPVGGSRQWEQEATEWQLDVERWALEDKKTLELARKGYISHVRAYATHVVPERHMFDVKGLHLGHLAKAFALRDRPGNMGRGSTASKKRSISHTGGRAKAGGRVEDDDDDTQQNNAQPDADIMAKMKKLARARERDQAGEFNFG